MNGQTKDVSGGDLRPFGWAGLRLNVPEAWRLSRTSGFAARGKLTLADDVTVRLEIGWANVTRRAFDAERIARRQMRRMLGKRPPDEWDRELRPFRARSVQPMLYLPDDEGGMDRFVGYAPAAQRMVQMAYRRRTAREDSDLRQAMIGELEVQPLDRPQQWAFFDISFIAPPGYQYESSKLNVGDMRVVVSARGRETRGPSLMVRQVYPAELALSRQPLEDWADVLLEKQKSIYRLPRQGWRLRRRKVATAHIDTPRGPGVEVVGKLRWLLRPMFWRMPRSFRFRLIHDRRMNRLLALSAADRRDRVVERLDEVMEGLHWAQRDDG